MTPRERFLQIARFERPNDPFVWGMPLWRSTDKRWRREGAPSTGSISSFLIGPHDTKAGIHPNAVGGGLGQDTGSMYGPPLIPYFSRKVLQEDDEYIVLRDVDGSTIRIRRSDSEGMPQWLDHPVKNRRDWDAYRKRLDPHSPGRFPEGWDALAGDPDRDIAVSMNCLSLYGSLRFCMGLENLSYAIYDDMALVEEMMEWQTHMSLEMLKKVFASGATLDYVGMFEDMCYKTAPLVSPEFVKRTMAPKYRQVVDLLRSHGVDIIIMDSDGDIEQLLPIWLDCGINGLYPLEVASGMDGVEIRRKYGSEIIITGHIDKRALALGKHAIDEVASEGV